MSIPFKWTGKKTSECKSTKNTKISQNSIYKIHFDFWFLQIHFALDQNRISVPNFDFQIISRFFDRVFEANYERRHAVLNIFGLQKASLTSKKVLKWVILLRFWVISCQKWTFLRVWVNGMRFMFLSYVSWEWKLTISSSKRTTKIWKGWIKARPLFPHSRTFVKIQMDSIKQPCSMQHTAFFFVIRGWR